MTILDQVLTDPHRGSRRVCYYNLCLGNMLKEILAGISVLPPKRIRRQRRPRKPNYAMGFGDEVSSAPVLWLGKL